MDMARGRAFLLYFILPIVLCLLCHDEGTRMEGGDCRHATRDLALLRSARAPPRDLPHQLANQSARLPTQLAARAVIGGRPARSHAPPRYMA